MFYSTYVFCYMDCIISSTLTRLRKANINISTDSIEVYTIYDISMGKNARSGYRKATNCNFLASRQPSGQLIITGVKPSPLTKLSSNATAQHSSFIISLEWLASFRQAEKEIVMRDYSSLTPMMSHHDAPSTNNLLLLLVLVLL